MHVWSRGSGSLHRCGRRAISRGRLRPGAVRAQRDDAGTTRAGTVSPACGSRRQRRVRRHHRVEWRVLRHASGPDPRPDRAERRRQDHAVQLPEPALPAERRRHSDGRREHPDPPAAPDRRNRHRPHLPERRVVSQSFGARQRSGRHPFPHQQRHHQRLAADWAGSAAARPNSTSASTRSSAISTSTTSPMSRFPACRSAPRSASSWRARWRPIRRSCCSTSPPAASITRKSMCSAI